jgi:CRISPR-associated protein Cas1
MNYGYAIIRGMIARSLVAHGLEASIGIGHCNKANAFNLADDLIEPFRGFVDYFVNDRIIYEVGGEVEDGLTPDIKRTLVSMMNYDLLICDQYSIVQNCIDVMIESYCRSLLSGKEELILPELCSLQVHRYE